MDRSRNCHLRSVVSPCAAPPASSFFSAEYYLGTVPFKASPEACTLRGELLGASGDNHSNGFVCFYIDIKNKPFSTPNHVAEAISAKMKESIDERCKQCVSRPSIRFYFDDRRFWFKNESKERFRIRLGSQDPTSILTKLGFSETLEVKPGQTYGGRKEWAMGNWDEHGGRAIEDQRIRSDGAFGKLRENVERILGTRKIGRGDRGEVGFHAGHLLVAEYLFSLVFLSMYRGQGRTMHIEDAVKKAGEVDDQSADEFEAKLSQVCNFDVGSTEKAGRCSIKIIMDEVQKVRWSEAFCDLVAPTNTNNLHRTGGLRSAQLHPNL